jgi:hypothetical protein
MAALRPYSPEACERNHRLIADYLAGNSLRETAKLHGISLQRVHQLLCLEEERVGRRILRPPHVGMKRRARVESLAEGR